jgi:hypothetical protein
VRRALGLLFLVGCKFPYPGDVELDGADLDALTATDASADASPPCVADSVVCDDANGIYVDCSSTGTIEFQMTCPLGCASGQEKCVDIDPSNGVATYLDMARDRAVEPTSRFQMHRGRMLESSCSRGSQFPLGLCSRDGAVSRSYW